MGLLRRIFNLVREEQHNTAALRQFLDHYQFFTFGTATITFFKYEDLETAQADYKIGQKASGITDNAVSWDKTWLVIGYENMCNDPILVDTYSPHLPVYTAMYDNGTWETAELAGSLDAFKKIIAEVNAVQSQSLSEEASKEALQKILDKQNPEIANWWWESLLEEAAAIEH